MTKDEALRLALEGFENIRHHFDTDEYAYEVAVKSITAIKQALEETPRVSPEPEPVAWMDEFGNTFPLGAQRGQKYLNEPMKPLYTSPPKYEPLTDEQVLEIAKRYALSLAFPYDSPTTPEMFARAIEAAHGIKEDA